MGTLDVVRGGGHEDMHTRFRYSGKIDVVQNEAIAVPDVDMAISPPGKLDFGEMDFAPRAADCH
jgi:hypothetical protein